MHQPQQPVRIYLLRTVLHRPVRIYPHIKRYFHILFHLSELSHSSKFVSVCSGYFVYNGLTGLPTTFYSHRFWSHPSATEDLIFHGWADPCKDEDHILDVNFLRNLTGYLADCHEAKLQPSVFQLILFLDHASSVLTPPFLNWVPRWILLGIHRLLAKWIAAGLLGYV